MVSSTVRGLTIDTKGLLSPVFKKEGLAILFKSKNGISILLRAEAFASIKNPRSPAVSVKVVSQSGL